MGNPYLSQVPLQRLLESGSLDGFIEQLNTSRDYQIQGTNASEVQQHLDMLFVKTIEQMKKDSSKKIHPFFDRYLEYHDVRFVKTAIKLKRKQKEIDETYHTKPVSSSIKKLVQHISSSESETLPEVLKEYGFPLSFIKRLKDDETADEEIDAGIDQFFINQLHKVKVPYKCQQPKHLYIKRLIDVTSIKLLLRAKQRHLDEKQCLNLFIDKGYEILDWKFKELCKADDIPELLSMLEGTSYAPVLKHVADTTKTSSVQPYTNALDQHLLTLLKDISNQYYTTLGPTLRFLYSKETEITNLKIIAKGLSENMPIESIKSLLRMEATV